MFNNNIKFLFLFIFIIFQQVSFCADPPPLLTSLDQNPLKICTIGDFPVTLTGIGFKSGVNSVCLFTSSPAGVNITVPSTYINSTNVRCQVPNRMVAGLTMNVLLSVSNDGVSFSNIFEIRYSGSQPWQGNIFLSGHDADFHGLPGFGNGRPFLIKSLDFITKNTWNDLTAPNRKKFLFIESKMPATGSDVKHSLPTLTSLGLTVGIHFDHVDATEFATTPLSDYSALFIASAGGGMLTTWELRALNDRKQDIAYFLKNGGGLGAWAQGIGSFTCTKNLAGISNALNSEAFAFLPITTLASPNILLPYSPTPKGMEMFNITLPEINDPSHSIFSQTGGLDIITYDKNNAIVTLAGQLNPCPDDCNGKGVCSCGECTCSNGFSGPYCECQGSDTCNVCGDGIIQGGEFCDGGIGCLADCTCGAGYEVTEPISPKCQELKPPRITVITKSLTSGSVVTIGGTNLGVDAGAISVLINQQHCTGISFVDTTRTSFTCTAPPGVGVGYDVHINASGRIGDGVGQPTFSYYPPTFTSASSSLTEGTDITITGTNLGAIPASSSIKLNNGGTCLVKSSAHTSLVCTAPAGFGTGLPFTINIGSQTTTGTFSYLPPTISQITKSNTQGSQITLVGTSFSVQSTTKSISFTPTLSCVNLAVIVDHKIMTCDLQAGSGGGYKASVTVGGQKSNDIDFSYNIPSITHRVAPPPTVGGTITINGYNFGTVQSQISVSIGGDRCDNVVLITNHEQLTCFAPEGTGLKSLIITVNGLSSLQESISYQIPVVKESTNPSTKGGSVVLEGSNFGKDISLVTVSIDGKDCPTTWVNENGLKCSIGAGTGSGKTIIVTVNTLVSVPVNFFSYAGPSIYEVSRTVTSGGLVTVKGDDFSISTSTLSIQLGGVSCTVNSVAEDQVIFTAPEGSGINIPLELTVDGLSTTDKYSYSSPFVDSVSQVETTGGLVTIKGVSFGNDINVISVTADKSDCLVKSVSHTEVTCTIGQGVGLKIPIFINVNENELDYSVYFNYLAPTILSATSSTTSGSEITIQGTSFGQVGTAISVSVSNQECLDPIVTIDHTTATCKAPAGSGKSNPLILTVATQTSNSFDLAYGLPTVSSSTKSSTQGGDIVTLTGSNFGSSVDSVLINDKECTDAKITVVDTQITCVAPPGTGSKNIIVVDIEGQESSDKARFSYNSPTVSSTSSPSTKGGDLITVVGANFGSNSSLLSVTVDGKQCKNPTLIKDDSELTCESNSGSGKKDIVVTVDELPSSVVSLSFAIPNILHTTSTPTQGAITTITGNNFGTQDKNIVVLIGGKACTDIKITGDHTVLECTAPVGTGVQDITITVDGLSNTISSIFSYDLPSISQNSLVSTIGGDTTTLVGKNLGNDASLINVLIGNQECKNVKIIVPHSSISCVAPSGQSIDNTITIAVNKQQTSFDIFNYDIPKPISATSVDTNGGVVTVQGTNFGSKQSEISVIIDDKQCTQVTLVTAHTTITCQLTGGQGFELNVNVTVSKQLSLPNTIFNYDDGSRCDDPTCSGNGVCLGGFCSCNFPYYGPSCSVLMPNETVELPTIDFNQTKPSTVITLPGNETINIFVKEVREHDINNQVVVRKVVSEMLWNLTQIESQETLVWNYTLLLDTGAFVVVKISYFLHNDYVQFAGLNISMPKGNVKFGIDLYDWEYQNSQNNVKVIMTAQVVGAPNVKCEQQVSLANNTANDNQLHWFEFDQNGNSLYGRFSNRAIIDSRVIPITQDVDRKSEDGKELDIAMNVPFFRKSAIMDPDFSVVLNFGKYNAPSTECSSGSKVKWYIPVSVVGGAAVAASAIGGFFYSRKLKKEKEFQDSIKMSSMNA
ncbi:hypothetical protein CYY_008152 [Polysphondylium violaceum]|uniref:EGF-like domain-containing protein n=1 Tax=Polysphondylium violaceum TaxID=133409 RepID=A0A8J4PQU6_9MYCE|nr:hypothetical protein CYY_008152 [Polysphondylium violaceum]